MSNSQPKKFFFSLKGVDLDDDALEAVAPHVWEQLAAIHRMRRRQSATIGARY